MLKTFLISGVVLIAATAAHADVDIVGTVSSKCVIQTDTGGVYGNPTSDKLSTLPADGGVKPIVRYDVSIGNAYKAKITYPTSFSVSPSLTDTVAWSGSVAVSKVSDAGMSDYDTNKVTYDATSEYALHTSGSTWFATTSAALYGYSKALPGGTYRAVVVAECIAN